MRSSWLGTALSRNVIIFDVNSVTISAPATIAHVARLAWPVCKACVIWSAAATSTKTLASPLGSLSRTKWATILACNMMATQNAGRISARRWKNRNWWRHRLTRVLILSRGPVAVANPSQTFSILVPVHVCWTIRQNLKNWWLKWGAFQER